MELHAFSLVAVVLALAAVAGMAAVRLRQPLIVAFIAVGILVGPAGTGWVVGDVTIELLAGLGIAILLFLVGLRLDLHLIRTTGTVALATGLGQVVFSSAVGFAIATALGMDVVTALYVAVTLTFSSTIIVVKLLSDKREIEQLHGRIAVGFLIVQDIVVVLAMIGLTAFGRHTGENIALGIGLVVAKGLGLLAGIAVLMRYVLPWLIHHVARSQELLVLFGVAYAVSVAALSDWLGFSSEVGAFLAGVSLASTRYRDALGARLVSLRDFLLLFFFLQLGAMLNFDEVAHELTAAAVFSAFVLIGKPFIVIVIVAAMRYPVRVGALTGAAVAQISEFSLILAALGLSLGHITTTTVSLITVVGLVTIGVSTYLILYSHQIYDRVKRWLAVFERAGDHTSEVDCDPEVDVILYGLGRLGGRVADQLGSAGFRVLAVDFDRHRVDGNQREGVTAVFGSAEDVHFLATLPLRCARYVISTVPQVEVNMTMLHDLRHHDYAGCVALTAHTEHDADRLLAAGADVVLNPFAAAATAIADTLHDLAAGDTDGHRDEEDPGDST